MNSLDRFFVWTYGSFLGIGDDDTGKDEASAEDGYICEVASGPLGCGVTQRDEGQAKVLFPSDDWRR